MIKRYAIASLLFPVFLVYLLWGGEEKSAKIRFSVPLDQAVYHEEYVSVVVEFLSPEVEGIVISAEMNQSATVMRQNGRNTYCKTMRLESGVNAITVTTLGSGNVQSISANLFHDVVSEKIYKYPPPTFVDRNFHVPFNEGKCVPCHKMEVNETPGIAFEIPSDSNCFSCHQKLTTRGQGHAPAVNWLCTSCHKTAQQLGKEVNATVDSARFELSKKVGEECLFCHKKEREGWDEKRFHHMPVDAAQCIRCHNPHSSPIKYFLKAKPWDICTSCHIDKRDGNHFINTFSRKDHPTKGKPDPSRPGEELQCISCHSPHAADTPSLLLAKSPMGICQKCHKK